MCWEQLCLLEELMIRFDLYIICVPLQNYEGHVSCEIYLLLVILLFQTLRFAEEVEKRKEQFEHYNILPLYAVGVKPAIMELPEVVYIIYSINT